MTVRLRRTPSNSSTTTAVDESNVISNTNGSANGGVGAHGSAHGSDEQHTHHGLGHVSFAPDTRSEKDKAAKLAEAAEVLAARWHNWHVRTLWTAVMIIAFGVILVAGHASVVALVTIIHTLVYREVISIAWVPSKAKKMPWFRTMTWYFLLSTNYYLYGQTVIQYFKQNGFVDSPLATHHSFVSFLLYVVGFVFFVFNLQKDHYKFQFSQFAWTHMTLLLVVVQSQFIIKNIFEGLVWFLLPVSLVICNDISAYVAGFFFGRTPLIQLSPKKTWEGFYGGFVATVIFGFFFSGFLNQYPYMICPVNNLRTNFWSGLECEPNPVFKVQDFVLSHKVQNWILTLSGGLLVVTRVKLAMFQVHAVVMALFASIIAPFGGFFASGAKRAFKLKDFGDYIPGHGGITDRMDCQFLMSFFAFLYYQSFIAVRDLTVAQAMETIVGSLSIEDQMVLYKMLGALLTEKGKLAL
ncbi:cytidylyltransferase family-domain-containing protein [Chytriomyces sp. MP71]|nr:cytidylyltransferase family-domain-containing protein [Chytriomyces sp. MP71]